MDDLWCILCSPADRDTCLATGRHRFGPGGHTGSNHTISAARFTFLSTRLFVKKAALLDGAASLDAPVVCMGLMWVGGGAAQGAAAVGARGRQVGDVFWVGMLGTDTASIDAICFARLGESVIATVKVFAFL